MRNFLNGKDERGANVEHSDPGRKRLMERCEQKAALRRGSVEGILPFKDVVDAFVTSRMQPVMSNEEFKAVFRGIEAYHDEA